MVLLSPLECTPNRAWIWKATPATTTTPSRLTTSSSSSSFTLTLAPLPSYFLPPPSQLALPVLVSSFFLSLLLSILSTISVLFQPFFPPSFSLFLTLNVSPTLNSTHSGWATQCSVWMSGAILHVSMQLKTSHQFDKYRHFCMETGQRLCLTQCADIMLLYHTTSQYTQRQPCFVGIALMTSVVKWIDWICLNRTRLQALCSITSSMTTTADIVIHVWHIVHIFRCVFRCMCVCLCVSTMCWNVCVLWWQWLYETDWKRTLPKGKVIYICCN